MKFYRIVWAVVLLLMMTSAVAAQSDDPLTFTETYSENGLRFAYPAGWVVVEFDQQIVLANSQAAGDVIRAGGTPGPGQVAVLILAIPSDGLFDAASFFDLLSQDESAFIVETPVERMLRDYMTLFGGLQVPPEGDSPGGTGALYVLDYSVETVFIALGVGRLDDTTRIEVVIEKMIKSLTIDEAAVSFE